MKRYEANEIRNMIIDECEKHKFCSSCPFYDKNVLFCSFSDTHVDFWERDGLYKRKPKAKLDLEIGEVSETEEKIWKMTAEELALLLRFIGIRNNQFPCMTETKIWRVARKFNEMGLSMSRKGAKEALELLVRAIKACEEEGEKDGNLQ